MHQKLEHADVDLDIHLNMLHKCLFVAYTNDEKTKGRWKDRRCRYQAERVSACWTPELVKLLCDTRHWPLARLTASCDPAF